jgi:hypothetical protein
MFIISVADSSGASGSWMLMQKLWSFARQLTNAITLLMPILAGMAHLRIPHRQTN